MINPSANGWIEKFLLKTNNFIDFQDDTLSFMKIVEQLVLFMDLCGTLTNFKIKINTKNGHMMKLRKLVLNTFSFYIVLKNQTERRKILLILVYQFYKIIQPENLNFIKIIS